ncbi:nucleic acid-binding protein [Treponema parvum]|uniref:Nucleic acid-binding protein n=1 Tax=Treponema parvum TaxID=138851 RepID=A0A975F3P7_9SPIR|nr:C4-type zinc ribbon domain-containing protein [Treponema parvum]QTQ13931.1 nucleic acid-binding protein [Treponema parvum]
MVMTEVFEKLKSLQDILVKRYEIEKKIEEAPKQLGAQEELLSRLKKEYIEKNTKYEEVRSKVLGLKTELEDAERQREAGEAGMDNITTHREYEALDKQITEANAKEQEIRKELSVQEKELSVLQENLKSDEEMISSSENDLNTSKAALDNELASFKDELSVLKKQEGEITPGIDQEIVYKFQRIIQRDNKGIVAVKNGVCEGCHMILPAQFANEVREGEKILFCPYCSRILYYQESEDEGMDNYFVMSEAGSLADLDDVLDEDENEDDEDLISDSDDIENDDEMLEDEEADDEQLDDEDDEDLEEDEND